MILKIIAVAVLLSCLAWHGAMASQLDELLPVGVPGLGVMPGITVLSRLHPDYAAEPIEIGDIDIKPVFSISGGYDTNVNGTGSPASAAVLSPSLLVTDTQLGFGAYAAANATREYNLASQNTTNYVFGLGERAALPQNTLTVAGAVYHNVETGFSVTDFGLRNPIAVTAQYLHAEDKWRGGILTITPEISITKSSYNKFHTEDALAYRQALTVDMSVDNVSHLLGYVNARETTYRQTSLNTKSYEAMLGVEDEAAQLWTIRVLAGLAQSHAQTGQYIFAPVIEASADWMPDELDSLTLKFAHEIGDPQQIEPGNYRLDNAHFALVHEYLRNIIVSGAIDASRVNYIGTPVTEDLYAAALDLNWHINRAISARLDYNFNDRQSNHLMAANEHVATVTLMWTP